MGYHYTDASCEGQPHALPDVETFGPETWGDCPACCATLLVEMWHDGGCPECHVASGDHDGQQPDNERSGFGFAFGFPGCVWDGEPEGPFDTEAEALAAAREASGYCAHGIADEAVCEECPAPERWVLRRPDSHSYVETVAAGGARAWGWTRDTARAAAWVSQEAAARALADCPLHAITVRLTDDDARLWGKGGNDDE